MNLPGEEMITRHKQNKSSTLPITIENHTNRQEKQILYDPTFRKQNTKQTKYLTSTVNIEKTG